MRLFKQMFEKQAGGEDERGMVTNGGFNFEPASRGESMLQFINWVKTYSTLTPSNIFEVGANMAQDAEALRAGFVLQPQAVWVFEPHPKLFNYITETYNFNAFDYAIADRNGRMKMNLIDPTKNSNSGISSLRTHKDVPKDNFTRANVQVMRMDKFLELHDIEKIDFMKLDVEGYNYEVLEGFGDKIEVVQSLHVEAEHYEHWEGEKLWGDIRALLEPHMEMVFFERHFTQSDSFWIKKEHIKANQ